jgi:hypothetical protein
VIAIFSIKPQIMKRKKAGISATIDLRFFIQKSVAKKKHLQPDIVIPSTNESQMQLVVFQGHDDTYEQALCQIWGLGMFII